MNRTPAVVDPKMTKPAPLSERLPRYAPASEKIFCSSSSAEDAMSLCKEWTAKEGGACMTIPASKACAYRAKVIPGIDPRRAR